MPTAEDAPTGRDPLSVRPTASPDVRALRTIDAVPVDVAEPLRIVIPAIGVDSEIVDAGLRPDGQLDVPDPGLAGWYTEGPRPGEPGPAVVVAHISTRRGPDVFVDLHRLAPGDLVDVVRADGTTGRWRVRSSEQTPKDELPVDRIWEATARPVLRLITCGGVIQPNGHYSDNVIVYLDPVHV